MSFFSGITDRINIPAILQHAHPLQPKENLIDPQPPIAPKVEKRSILQNTSHSIVDGAMNALEERVASKKFNQQTKLLINNLLLAQVSQDVFNLKALLQKAKASLDTMNEDDIATMKGLVDTLIHSPILTEEERQKLQGLSLLIQTIDDDIELGILEPLARMNLQRKGQEVEGCITVLTEVIKREQGALLTAVKFLRKALLDPERGMLKAANIQLTEAEDSILKNALRVLTQTLFGDRAQELAGDGIAGGLSQVAKDALIGEGGIVPTTVHTAKDALIGDGGVVPTALHAAWHTVVGKDGMMPEALNILSDHLKRKPHPLLLQLQAAIRECKQALAQNQNSNALDAQVQRALELVQQIKAEINTVLPLAHEHHPDFIKLQGIEALLQGNLEVENPFLEHDNPLTSENLGEIEQFLQVLCGQQQNVLDQATDILLKKLAIAPTLLINNLTERLGILDQPSANGAGQAGAMGGFLGSIGGVFKQMLSKGAAAISKEALGAFASLIVSFIQKVEAKIDPKFDAQKAGLQGLILDINNQKDTDGINLEDLKGFFERLLKICNTIGITLSGLYLPHFDEDSDEEVPEVEPTTDAYENVEILNSAHDETTPVVKPDYETLALNEKDALATNTVSFIMLKFINETVRHKQPDRAAYLTMMQRAKQLNAPSLERMVFDDIRNERNSPWYTSWWHIVCTWFVFKIAHSMIQTFVKRASDAYMKEAFDHIRQQKLRHFEDFTSKRISDANNYLSVLNAAFESLPKIETTYGDTRTMIKREMENPLRNHFHTVDEINEEFAQNVIEKGTGNRTVAWIFGKILRNKQNWVKYAIDEMMGSMRDVNGYSHALNTVIVEFLEDVEKSMKKAAREKAAKPVHAPMSKERKKDLADLLKNLFQVLEKTAGKKEIHGLFDVLKKRLEDTFGINIDKMVIEQVMDNSTFILADAIDMLAQEDQLQKTIYSFTRLLNQSYEIGAAEPSPQEKLSKENRVQELATDILRKSISQSVNERADLTKEQKEVNTAIESLLATVNAWCVKAIPELQALEGMDRDALNSQDARTKIATLHSEMIKFQTELKLIKARITHNPWKEEVNKNAVIKRIEGVEKASNALVHMIKDVERRKFLLEKHAAFAPQLQKLQQIAHLNDEAVSFKMRLHELEGIETLFNDDQVVMNLRSLLTSTEEEPTNIADTLVSDLHQQFGHLAIALRSMDRIEPQRTFVKGLFDGDTSWIHQILEAKSTRPTTVKSSFEILKKQVLSILPEEKRRLFLDALSGLIQTKAGSAQENQQKHGLAALCAQSLEEANAAYQACGVRAHVASQVISSIVAKTKLLDPDYVAMQNVEIGSDLEDGANNVKDFQKICQEILTEVPFANIDLIPAKTSKKLAKNIVFETTKSYTDELLQFFARPEIAHSGLRHMVLMPYNRHEKEKRTGNPVGYDDHAPAYKKIV